MVGREKANQAYPRGLSQRLKEDRINQLPDPLICYILSHLPPKECVKTSVLSTRWRSLWLLVPSLEFVCWNVPNFNALPCLKIIHLEDVEYPNEPTLEKLISGSPVLEDLTLIRFSTSNANALQVRSQTLKRIRIHQYRVVIDAPLLQCLRTKIDSTKNFEIINLGFSTKLDIDVRFRYAVYSKSLIHDILTDISRVKDIVISNAFWKDILLYSNSGPVLQFRHLSCLNARFSKSHLEMLPTILESCPKLESFILELVNDDTMPREKKKDPKVMFSTVPQCLVTSLKFLELKRGIAGYEGELRLIRYFLKNSTILKKLRLDVYYTQKTKYAFIQELVAIPRCSAACEVHVL